MPDLTPLCPIYSALYVKRVKENGKKAISSFYELKAHRATCPACRKRMQECNEIARKAEYPEVKDG